MGTIRLLLALSVLIAHAGPLYGLTLVGGKMAVQSFFIISGFYMAFILHEKYIGVNNSYHLYLTNRLLRIFPLYWILLLLTTVLLSFFQDNVGSYVQLLSGYHPLTLLYLVLTNIFILGQDIGMFLELSQQGLLYFSTAYEGTTPFVYLHLLVPQGWTLAIELSFYFLAPFLVKRKLIVLGLLAILSLGLRFFLYNQGLHHEPWTNRFFPTEFFFFLLGILSYRFSKKIAYKKIARSHMLMLYSGVICFTLFFSFLPKIHGLIDIFQAMYYLTLTMSMPVFFYFYRKNRFDAFFGELAYPVFVSHFFVIYLLRILLPESSSGTVLLTIFLTMLLSWGLLKLVEPITRFRQTRVKLASQK